MTTSIVPSEAAAVADRLSWAAELAWNLVNGMVVLVVFRGLCKMERHCLRKVVFGRDEPGRGREFLYRLLTCREVGHQECANLVGSLLFTLCARKWRKLHLFAVRSSPNGILLENRLLLRPAILEAFFLLFPHCKHEKSTHILREYKM